MSELLHDLVHGVAKHTPDAIAFTCGKVDLSYRQLDVQSNQLAHLLVKQGLELGDRVGVFMPRGIETAIAIYGILKAGGVFVPIDPVMPAEGARSLIDNCGIRFLLTHPKKHRALNQLFAASTRISCVIGVDAKVHSGDGIRAVGWNAIDSQPTYATNKRTQQIRPQDPAYIMYSSGSTGRPKGITHTHASGMAYARLSVETYGVTSDDLIANHSPINFDMSTFGYFASCYAGAKTLLVRAAYTKAPASLAKLVSDQRVTIWYSVPLALVQMLLYGSLSNYDMSHLRWVLYGGEPFTPKHLKSLMKQWPHARVSNVYGPAEVNQCTFYHVPNSYADATDNLPVPIGKVWNETRGLVIDQDDKVIDDDQLGELVICSTTMMLGYWGQPKLNQKAFFHHADAAGTPQIYYRTGDLVQRREDGNMMFLGRKDRQVKVRGYRVELDDIERTLTNHPQVEEAGVYWILNGEEKEIHATIIVKPDSLASEADLKRHLASCLSPYAIPNRIGLVDDLPRTGSGKIDRKILKDSAQINEINPESKLNPDG